MLYYTRGDTMLQYINLSKAELTIEDFVFTLDHSRDFIGETLIQMLHSIENNVHFSVILENLQNQCIVLANQNTVHCIMNNTLYRFKMKQNDFLRTLLLDIDNNLQNWLHFSTCCSINNTLRKQQEMQIQKQVTMLKKQLNI